MQTNEQASFSENWVFSWQWKSSRIRQQFYRQENFAMNMDTHMTGWMVKNHISLKKIFEYNVILKTSYQSRFLVYVQLLQARLPQHPRLLPLQQSVWSESVDRQERDCWRNQPKSKHHHKNYEQVRETRIIPTYWSGCKNSERILCMAEFLNAEALNETKNSQETHRSLQVHGAQKGILSLVTLTVLWN